MTFILLGQKNVESNSDEKAEKNSHNTTYNVFVLLLEVFYSLPDFPVLTFFLVSSWLPFSLLCITTEIVDLYTNSGTNECLSMSRYICMYVNMYVLYFFLHRGHDVRLPALPLVRGVLHRDQPHPVRHAQLQLPEGVPDYCGKN